MSRIEIEQTVKRIIGETFNCPPDTIQTDTTAEDVDGWDSLKHTILMIRLQRALGFGIPEDVASQSSTVGDLIDRLDRVHKP